MVIGGALFGGNANNGTNAGFGYLNANNRSSNSNANIGFRFYRCGFNFQKITVITMTVPHKGYRYADSR